MNKVTKHRLSFFVLLCVFSLTAMAQPRLLIERDVMNVGEVLFQQSKTVRYELKNTGDKPLTITDVNPSCGCTKAEMSTSSIEPQETATLMVVFDAQILGTFQKEIELRTNASEDPVYLTLQGRVVSTASEYEGDFPVEIGSVRLSTNNIEFDDVNVGDFPEAVLQIVNMGRKTYKPELMHLPPYLTARYQPEQLAGGRVGRIILTLSSNKLKNYGLTETSIYLARYMGDKVSADNEIEVSAVLLPAFAHLTTEELRKAPQMVLSDSLVDFSNVAKKKKMMSKALIIRNTGQQPLNISRVQVYGKALTIKLSDRIIRPGKQAKLKVTLNTEVQKKAKKAPRVLLITDDPNHPKTVLKIKN